MDTAIRILFVAFSAATALVWFLVFGYILALSVAAALKKKTISPSPRWPGIAIVVPTLNEEALILDKLEDLRKIDYPKDRVEIVVVDGGSADLTADLVRNEIDKGHPIRLVCLKGPIKKIDQVNRAMEMLPHDILVFTDADARLEPSCIKRLVALMMGDPRLAIVGASVVPQTPLVEERIHWRLMNLIWWLEGEVFVSAGFSGVCYAVRRKVLAPIPAEALTEDISLALAARARGWRVRICRPARVSELRAPKTAKDLFEYRRRRGSGYLAELLRARPRPSSPLLWRLARWVRISQFCLVPWTMVSAIVLGGILAFTGHRLYVLLALGLLLISAFSLVFFLNRQEGNRSGCLKLGLATLPFGILTLVSMLTLSRHPTLQVPRGGKP